ncbi:putative quinol monooxygenase [Vibrio sp. MarTm2]|jgi:quinol monooxygenase YgiN|uniref:putative quinol monooxygenase n=1 Tax=Vibrio sp. MarTm2 TaxID=2998831 RepID=UPI0022CDB173|nr:putative quinol monooxygenase [Vibrio sp. MarTm2]MDA0127548.1 putative quinol monooxygenase [Vibrio sp. MarTm2]
MIHLTATFDAKDGAEQDLQALLTALIEPTRNEPGCVSYRLFKDTNVAGRFVFQEQFADQEAFDFHSQQPYLQNLLGQLDGILKGEPVITFFEEIE